MADSPTAETATTPLGHKLRQLREGRGWSRETLARKAGTTPLTILRAEVHGTSPTLASLQAWAGALNVPVSELVDPE